MTPRSLLGAYLTARREVLRPEDVALEPDEGRRRVRGLRREEVAALAGVSPDYYLRLEQGRDHNPSDQVLEALARALRLDEHASAHLHELAHPTPALRDIAADDTVEPRVQVLIDSWPRTAAVVHNRAIDVIASNPLARALHPTFDVGHNSLLSLLVDPSSRDFYRNWDGLTERSVALLRLTAGTHVGDARISALIAELTERSERFRELWARNDVINVSTGIHPLTHPVVGDLHLNFARLAVPGTDGHTIYSYFADPGSPSEAALEQLAAGWE